MPRTYILILGAPRSGTTLLTAMIGSHDEVAMLNEDYGRAMDDILAKPMVGNKLCIPNHIELTRKKPYWTRRFGPWLHYHLYRRGYFRYRPEASLSIEDYLTSYSPLKIIGIIRNGNAIISSIMKRGEQPYEVAAYRWRRSVEILHELHTHQAAELLLLSFEQLVREPEQTVEHISDYLELSYDPKMLQGYAHTPEYSNRQIDPDRAMRAEREGIDFGLAEHYPEAYARYEQLLQRSKESRMASSPAH